MRRKFTLIEILIVIGIIGLLAALSFGAYSFAMNKSRESATKALLKRVEAGLESCKTKFGYYPQSTSYTTITVSLDSSSNAVTDITIGGVSISPEMRKEFLRIVDGESLKKSVTGGKIVDHWGNDIYYRYPGTVNTSGIDIISSGADGKWGDTASTNKDDVKNTSDDLIN